MSSASVRFVFLFLFCFQSSVHSQPVGVPQLDPQHYNWQQWQSLLQQSYSVANGSHSITNWDAIMLQSYAVLQSEWQAEIQMQISSSVSQVHTQDGFQSVQDYKSYLYDALQSQASGLLTQWQVDAERSIQLERNHFIDTYYQGNAAQVATLKDQFDSEFHSFISGNSPSLSGVFAGNGNLFTNTQMSLRQLEQQWYSQFNSNIQNGLYNYQEALQALNNDYAKLLSRINSTEAQYQAYLQQIRSYEDSVKDQIKQTMDGYQQFLNSTDLFWNTASALYDSKANGGAGGYVGAPSCASGNICVDYLYDVTLSQFVSSCNHGDVCITLRYDTTTQNYSSPSCPSGGDCSSNPTKNISIHTSLNGDGKAFQAVINSIETAITQGLHSYGIFDSTTGQLLSYPQSCLNEGAVCNQGQYDLSASKFLNSTVCPSGHVCYNAVVDRSNPSSLTGLYYANTCPAGDVNCVACPSSGGIQDSCQIQSFEASLMYAATTMSQFLAHEQGVINTELSYILSGTGSGGTQGIDLGGFNPFDHGMRPSHSPNTLYITTQDFLEGQYDLTKRTGLVGLAWEIVSYIQGGITEKEFANWIMNAASAGSSSVCPGTAPGSGSPTIDRDVYNSNDFDPGCLGAALRGLAPGVIVDAVSRIQGQTDLIAFNDRNYIGNSYMILEGGPNNWNQDPAYCHDGLGCFFNPFGNVPAIGGANQWFQSNPTIIRWGENNFYNYTEDQAGVYKEGVGLVNTVMKEDSIGIVLNYTTVDTNAHANAMTWQALSTQLQSFSFNWNQNILPAISNWTSQTSTYETQYLNWQKTEAALIAEAQSDYSNTLRELQKSETAWLVHMNDLQTKATSDFTSANNKLRDSKLQADADLVAKELFSTLLSRNGETGLSVSRNPSGFDLSASHSNLFGSLFSSLNGIDPQTGLPSFSILQGISTAFSNASAGLGNLSLLSSTNNALLNSRSNYMQQLADSLRSERTFTQNGESNLLKDHGNLSTKVVGDTTYLVNNQGYFVHCDTNGSCTSCGTDANACDGGKATDISTFLKNVCGEKLDSCNQYTKLKYSNVAYDSKTGEISLDESIYDGKATSTGNDQDASTYRFGSYTQHLTIRPPVFLLGQGANSFGNIFDSNHEHGEDKIMSSFVGRSFENMNNFFQNSHYTNTILASVNALDSRNNYNTQAAWNSASGQAHTANLIADYLETLYLGGGMKDFIKKETHNLVQGFIATTLANIFHLTPEGASFLAGAYMDHEAAQVAERHLGILKPIDNFFKTVIPTDALVHLGIGVTHADDLRAIKQWKDDKYAAYGQIVAESMRAQNLPPDQIALVTQVVTEYFKMRDAKMELGMRGGMFSLSRLEGTLKAVNASIGGAIAELEGALFKNFSHDLKAMGMISARDEQNFDKNLRYAINDTKMVYEKNAIKAWQADVVAIAKDAVQLYGKQQGMDPTYVNQVADMVGNMVYREQARSELKRLHLTEDIITAALGGGVSYSYLDRSLFKGGLTKLTMQLGRGILTSQADIGRALGLFTKSETKDFYKQTKDWSDSVTGDALEAKSRQGNLDKHWWKEQERGLFFDLIGKTVDPNGDPAEQHLIGQLLQRVFDERQAKKQARQEREHQAIEAVEIAASIAITVLTEGAASQTLMQTLATIGDDIKNFFTFSGEMASVIRGGAVVADVAAQTYMGNKDGGTNGAVAGFVNGLLSTFTLYNKLPVSGFVSWTPHENANILYGTGERKGGWGGGAIFAAPTGSDLPINGGLTFTPGSGLDLNLNYNFKGGYIGLDYNFASGNYTANGGMDVYKNGTNGHHVGLSLSASKDGSASVGGYYNYGKDNTPPNLRGYGGTLTYSNDGKFNLGAQVLGGTAASIAYNSNTHRFEKVQGNTNWQNEMLLAKVQENANHNFEKSLPKVADAAGQVLSSNNIISEAERISLMSNPEGQQKILELYSQNKEGLINSVDGERVRGDMREIAEKNNLKLEFVNDSPTSELGKTLARIGGDIKMMFGIADSGLMAVDGDGKWKVKTCFTAGTPLNLKGGTVPIETARIGDIALSWNEVTGKFEYKPITQLYVHEVPQLYNLELDGEEQFQVTWNHPIRVRKKGAEEEIGTPENTDWVIVEKLGVGDHVLKSDGTWATLTDIYYHNVKPTKVYNLEVEDNHTYVVGSEVAFVVHNYANGTEYELTKGARVNEENQKMVADLEDSVSNKGFLDKLFGRNTEVTPEVQNNLKELKTLLSQRNQFAEDIGAAQSLAAARRSEKFVELLKTEEKAKQTVADLKRLQEDNQLRLQDKTLLPEEIKGVKALDKYIKEKLGFATRELTSAEKAVKTSLATLTQEAQKKFQTGKALSLFEMRSGLDTKLKNIKTDLSQLQTRKASLEMAIRLNPKDEALRTKLTEVNQEIQKSNSIVGGRYLELIKDNVSRENRTSTKANYEKAAKLAAIDNQIREKIKATLAIVPKGSNGEFTGKLSYLNTPDPEAVNVKAHDKNENYFDKEHANRIRTFGSEGMPNLTQIKLAMSHELEKGIPLGRGHKAIMSETQFKEAIARVTEKPEIPKLELDFFGNPTKESVAARGEALLKYADTMVAGQGPGKGMEVQSSVIIEMIRQMGPEKFGPNPELVKRASKIIGETQTKIQELTSKYENGEINKGIYESEKTKLNQIRDWNSDVIALRDANLVKEFVFQKDKSGKLIQSRELALKMSSAICRVLANHTQATFSEKTNLSFGEYMINKMQNGDVKMSGGAPVFDVGRLRGFEEKLSKSFDSSGMALQNNFPDLSFKDGKIVGVTNPISMDTWNKFTESLPEGAVIQVWGNSDEIMGPNHFWILYKKDGAIWDYNNNGGRDKHGKAEKFKPKKYPVYGVYHN
ncbi:TIGR04388 family protein [Leptospira inadai serovar Lyme]|uniref:TIGR04388 family protein n=1 Tax=Leptospira inadai serovar Lyme TaxID=293084 RepID=A0ABX4YD08_9LEPT|nr:TIGR04388 family protein [Leptospira inadai serovar Lyme]